MGTPITTRNLCASILVDWYISGRFPDRLIPEQAQQRAFIQETVYGCIRWQRMLDWLIDQLSTRPPDPMTRAYLTIGLYQLFLMDHVPAHAAINETVQSAKCHLDPPRVRFINALLRSSQRQHSVLSKRIEQSSPGVRLSHPDLLIQRWARQYKPFGAEALCQWNNQRPSTVIRLFSDASASVVAALDRIVQPHPASPLLYRKVPPGTKVTELPGFDEGAFFVQDPAAGLSVNLLHADPGESILDACAAPGGKTMALADNVGIHGRILAIDKHADRLATLNSNLKRTRRNNVRTLQADASDVASMKSGLEGAPFDRILLDVPCSNTGVLNRRPDARWRFSEKRLAKLVALQKSLLDAMLPLLAPQGALVYSTCSLEEEENKRLIASWLESHPDFICDQTVSSFPPDSGMDGAFAARLIRKV